MLIRTSPRRITALLLSAVAVFSVCIPSVRAQSPDGAFGSVAISASNVAYMGRWNTILAERADDILNRGCDALSGLCDAPAYKTLTGTLSKLSGTSLIKKAEAVNSAVNREITYTSDQKQHGSADYWALAQETLASGRGDCEDIALVKMWMLRAAGFSPEALHLVLVKDTRRNLDHAVLLVQLEGRTLVLDNLSDIVSQDSDIRSYEPVVSLSAAGAWIHGFRAPTNVAQN